MKLRYLLYILFGFFAFLFFTYINFPYEQVKSLTLNKIKEETGIMIQAESLGPAFPFGFQLDNVTLNFNETKKLTIPSLTLKSGIIGFLFGRPKLTIKAAIFDGSFKGTFQKSSSEFRSKISLNSLQLDNPITHGAGLKLKGALSGKITLSGPLTDWTQSSGDGNLELEDFVFDQTTLYQMDLPRLDIKNGLASFALRRGNLTLKDLRIGEPTADIELIGKGDILLQRYLPRSTMNLNVRLRFSEKTKKNFELFLPLMAKGLDPQGYYNISVSGMLGSPSIVPKQ